MHSSFNNLRKKYYDQYDTNSTSSPRTDGYTRINTPGEYRAWQDAEGAYFAALRNIEVAKKEAAEMAKAEANRVLSEQEYYVLACQRENERKAAAAASAAAAAEKAAARAEVDRLSGSPAVADVMHRNEWAFLQEICHWSRRQYTLNDLHSCMPMLYHATMSAPAAPAAPAAKGGK